MKTKTITLSPQQIKTLQHQMKAYPTRTLDYTHFQAKLDKGTITAYTSGKVVFSGEDALLYAQQFETTQKEQAGSDEVGTGDYFGPVIVCAAYVSEKQSVWLKQFNILDSKQITDQDILKLAPHLMNELTYSVLVLDNQKYNEVHQTTNLNAIKARLHQKAYDHLKRKLNGYLPSLCVVDQFSPKEKYYAYLLEDYGITHLHFETKAENKYISVACASIMARYTFLKSLEQLSTKYDLTIPKGASTMVDHFGKTFVERYGQQELKNVAKLHFSNTSRIIE